MVYEILTVPFILHCFPATSQIKRIRYNDTPSHLILVLRTTRKQNLFRAILAKDILHPSSITLSNPGPIKVCVYLRQIAVKKVHYFGVRQRALDPLEHLGAQSRNRRSRFRGRNKTLGNIPKHRDQRNIKIRRRFAS
jgi:hypothetical protein